MPAREYLMLVKESSYGVPMEDPVKGTDLFYVRLSGSNAFGMQSVPLKGNILYGGGVATPACGYSDQHQCTGSFQGEMYAGAFAKFIADWCLTTINSGRTTPWATTDSAKVMPVGDLASISAYHGIQLDDSTYDVRRYAGIKVASGSFAADRQNPLLRFNLQLQGMRDDLNAAGEVAYPDETEFPFPAETDYPCNPYLFSHTSGKLKIASARTLYSSVTLNWTSKNAAQWFEDKYVKLIKYCGRETTLGVNLYMKKTPDDLASLKAMTALDTELTFDNGVNTLKFDLNTKNQWSGLVRDLPIDNVYAWNGTLQNYFDGSTGSDVVVSAT